jgi:hypothetical protein
MNNVSNEFNNRETENKSANEPEQTVDKTDADIETELEKPVDTPASESKVRTDKKISLSTFIFSASSFLLWTPDSSQPMLMIYEYLG